MKWVAKSYSKITICNGKLIRFQMLLTQGQGELNVDGSIYTLIICSTNAKDMDPMNPCLLMSFFSKV